MATTTDADALDRADMQRLASGQDAALNELMARHATPIYGFLTRLLGNEADAHDLAQETFARVFRARASFRPGAKFTTWLYSIAGNLARNHFRWRSRHPEISLDGESREGEGNLADTLSASTPAPNDSAVAGERARAVRNAVNQLPEELREALVLCEWEELPVRDAAEVMDVSPKAVESRLYRARQLLRERLSSLR